MNEVIVATQGKDEAPGWSHADRLARHAVFAHLGQLGEGRLIIHDAYGRAEFGVGDAAGLLTSIVTVTDARFYRLAALKGGLGVAEGYINGWWQSTDLLATFRVFVRRIGAESALERTGHWILSLPTLLAHRLRRNTRAGSRRNIHFHYDLGNDLFRLFLDETMTYSCGIFTTPATDLRAAAVAKYDRICRKLELAPHHHVVETGSGWGGFAIHAARHYGCRVTTATISGAQHTMARQLVAETGLDHLVNVVLCDYRDLEGQFDRLVSIEMVEAVGHDHLGAYFAKCSSLLKPDGAMAIQAITVPDQRYRQYLRSVDFIRQFVFPGGCGASRTALLSAITGSTDMRLTHLEEIGPHYATTLRLWRERFMAQLECVRDQGYSEEFMRLWEFYLAYCEVGFSERHIGTVQMLLHKPACRNEPILPPLTNGAPRELDQ